MKVLDRPGATTDDVESPKTNDFDKLFGGIDWTIPLWVYSYGVHDGAERHARVRFDAPKDGALIRTRCLAVFKSQNKALRYNENVRNPFGSGKAIQVDLDAAREIAKIKPQKVSALALIRDADPKDVEDLHWID